MAAPDPRGPRSGDRSRATLVLGTALVVVDVLLIVGNVVHLRVGESNAFLHPVFADPAWNGYFDNSYAELFGYAQLVCAVVALGFVWRDQRAGVYAAWVLVLLAVLADDLLLLHERGGEELVSAWDLPAVAGLRSQDLGELAVWGLLTVVCLPALLIAHLRAGQRDRRNSWILLGLTAVLAVPAVLVDMLAVVLAPHVPIAGLRRADRARDGR